MKLLIISFFFTLTCFSQENDSLLYQIQHIENDTERVNQLYKTGFDLRNTDPESAFKFAAACEEEALKTNSKKHLAKSYNLQGVLFYKKGDYTKALQYQKKSLTLNQAIHNENGIAINQTNLGNIYSEINYLKLAEQSYLLALQSYNKTNNTLHIARSLLNIGVLKYNQKQLDAALSQFKEALVYANEIGDYDLIASCYNNTGTILREQNKLDSALFYLEEGLKMRNLLDNEVELADSYNNIAIVYIKQKNFSQAFNYISMANEIATKYDYTDALLELYHTQSLFYEAQQNYEQANVWLKKHYELKDSLQKIERENKDLIATNDPMINEQTDNPSRSHTNNMWLLISVFVLLIGVPLFLIRYKR